MRISIWELENRIRVISAAQILNALMNRLHPIPFISRLRAVSYHSTLRAHVKSERRSREEREWKLSLHPNLSSFLPLICIILLFRSSRVALREKKRTRHRSRSKSFLRLFKIERKKENLWNCILLTFWVELTCSILDITAWYFCVLVLVFIFIFASAGIGSVFKWSCLISRNAVPRATYNGTFIF